VAIENPTDEAIEAALATAPEAAWAALRGALDELEALDASGAPHGEWVGGWMETSEAVRAAAAAAAGVGAVVVFAWPDWPEIDRYRRPEAFEGAPVADVARMVTAMVRSDRFTEGSLAGAADDGLLQAALRRLVEWRGLRR
jgi:hypothetical protein